MGRFLPAETVPPSRPTTRIHVPETATGDSGYTTYRQCLRREFAFTCVFCLTHEQDLFKHGIDGTGLTAAEHVLPKSSHDLLRNSYDNLVYICRFCNGNRGKQPNVKADGSALLDPTSETWSAHFNAGNGYLKPVKGDTDAEYTYSAYRLDDRRKVEMRRARATSIAEARRTIAEAPSEIARLRARALVSVGRERASDMAAAELMAMHLGRARRDLDSWKAEPDPVVECGCGLNLAGPLVEQWLDDGQ